MFGLKWRHFTEQSVTIEQRIYRRKIDTPKTHRSARLAALAPGIVSEIEEWKGACPSTEPDARVFPSERLTTPLARDNWWRRDM